MKIWYGYGSEHSMNLVMIGHFKNTEDSGKTYRLIQQLTNELIDKIDVGSQRDRFDEDVMNLLKETRCYNLSPIELEQFLYDVSTHLDKDKIVITTEESEISAFLKLMIENGAKVEIYSAHDYPETDYGRGK
ncbi:MAG: hypothetical protein KKI12_06815 [Proteobacteria bacterium]|nr:hypothetical protein [Pseudomonadota bacterium]MBU4287869.1 hypothetical protein [Pseudomonadota bacterium]MBU4413990.1 hypothetical protein [Pseudomonadota bacterium]MCG2757234.1 DUF6375 family protein [Desulfobacteraceae bacterium]